MLLSRTISVVVSVALVSSVSAGTVTVNYTVDGGGTNTDPLNGLAARATFNLSGLHLEILLENTSTGVPVSFLAADSLLASLGMNFPGGVAIASGNTAVIGPDSVGIGSWAGRAAGNSVAEEWLWTNDFGGDLMISYAQVISTSAGQGGGSVTRFDGGTGTVDGPSGGMAAMPVLVPIPGSMPAVSNGIRFELTLSGTLSQEELKSVARTSIVEFGSDRRYLIVPEPGSLGALGVGVFTLAGRRRR